MKANIGKLFLALGLTTFILWMIVISICVLDIYDTQSYLVSSVDILEDCVATLQECADIFWDHIYGPFEIMQIDLSVETKELIEDLRWKHYPFFRYTDETDWVWEQSYPYIWFEDGIFYITEEDVTWFIKMQRKEE